MNQPFTIRLNGQTYTVTPFFGHYMNGRVAIRLFDAETPDRAPIKSVAAGFELVDAWPLHDNVIQHMIAREKVAA